DRACRLLVLGRDRVFQVDDHLVGGERRRLREHPLVRGGNRQAGAARAGGDARTPTPPPEESGPATLQGLLAPREDIQRVPYAPRRRVIRTGHRRNSLEAGCEGGVQDRYRCLRPVTALLRVGRDDAADVELASPVDLLPLEAGKCDSPPALALDCRPETHPS